VWCFGLSFNDFSSENSDEAEVHPSNRVNTKIIIVKNIIPFITSLNEPNASKMGVSVLHARAHVVCDSF
jgi:hypothetical protein